MKSKYIDGFAFPISKKCLNQYKQVSEKVAEVWKEHGALAYYEFLGQDLELEGTLSFASLLKAKKDEAIIFGLVVFESKRIRDLANQRVAKDPRMEELVSPLMNPSRMVFDASRMAFGGFESFIESNSSEINNE